MRKLLLVSAFLLTALPVASAAGTITGRWDAVVVANKVEVPFRFEIAQNGAQVQGFFFEGDRKIGSTSGTFANGILQLDYDFLNTTLQATLDGDKLQGTYRNHGPKAVPMEFRAQRSAATAASSASAKTLRLRLTATGKCTAPPRIIPSWTCPGGFTSASPVPKFPARS